MPSGSRQLLQTRLPPHLAELDGTIRGCKRVSSRRCCCSAKLRYPRAGTGCTRSNSMGIVRSQSRAGGRVLLRSRNDNDFTKRYAAISAALKALPDETVIDGEVVALGENG